MNYNQSPLRIYVHCPKDDCGCHRAAVTFLHSWGIEAAFQYDGDHYLEVVIPDGWSQGEIKRFGNALSRNLTVGESAE